MNIHTCAHGAFPDIKSLAHDGPRIAFVNGDSSQFAARGTHESGNLLIVVADDINADQIGSVSRLMLGMPAPFSSRYKQLHLRRSAAKGFPSVPMGMSDAIHILEFARRVRASEADELLISCEYGKSRSVTTAIFLEHEPSGSPSVGKVPNQWVCRLLERANLRQPV